MPGPSPKRVRRLLLVAAVLLLVTGIGVGVGSSALIFIPALSRMTEPVAELDGGESVEIVLPDHRVRYAVLASVRDKSAPSPEATLTVTTGDGEALELTEVDYWAELLGRRYRSIAHFPGNKHAVVTVSIEADQSEDFAVYPWAGDVMSRSVSAAGGWWIASAVMIVLSVALFIGLIFSKAMGASSNEPRFDFGTYSAFDDE